MSKDDDKVREFLVFEQAPAVVNQRTGVDQFGTPVYGEVEVRGAIPFTCAAAVRCSGNDQFTAEEVAIQTVMRATRRISKFAVVECSVIDFGTFTETEGASRPQLNA